jgi:hypothetical protein
MENTTFTELVHRRFNKCLDILTVKSLEYTGAESNRDVLSNFKTAAALQHCTAIRALGGMLAKHTVAIHDFCNEPYQYAPDQWHEKISDVINYLLLLEALVDEFYEDIVEDGYGNPVAKANGDDVYVLEDDGETD